MNSFFKLIQTTFYLLLFLANIVNANSYNPLKGAAFTDPGNIMPPKSEEWLAQEIIYPKKYQGADIFLTLDQQLYPALLPIINQYAQQQQLNIKVHEGTCGISSGMLGRKEADIGGFCCPPGRTDRLQGLSFHTLGISSIAFLVHPENNQIDDISFKQLQNIFAGDIQRWSDLNTKANSNLIHPVARLHCKLRPGHWHLILDNEEMFSARLNEVSAIPDMISFVANDPNAIGYETLWMTTKYKNRGEVKWLKINGINPDDRNALAQGKYPVYRTYNITSWQSQKGNKKAQELVEYLIDNVTQIKTEFELIPAHLLIKNGWKFNRGELIGEPDKK